MIPISRQLGRYFSLVALTSILLITVLSNVGMNLFFADYLRTSQQTEDQAIAAFAEELLKEDGMLDATDLMSIEHYAFTLKAEVIMEDATGEVLMSTRQPDKNPVTGQMEYRDLIKFSYREYPYGKGQSESGLLIVGRPKSIFTAPSDRRFLIVSNLIYLVAAGLSLFISMAFRNRIKGKFLRPIYAIQDNARSIKQGDFLKVQEVYSDTIELDELSQSINSMAHRLDEQERLRKRLTSDIAHELRTPLSTINSHLEAFMDGVWEPTPQRLALLQDEIRRLTHLIRDLGDLSYMESGKSQMTLKTIDLSQLVANVIENFGSLFFSEDKDLNASIEPGIQIQGDEDRLNQLFINLVANALKYTNRKGRVRVTIARSEQWAEVTIIDDGIGIDASDLPFIFERFYRSDRSRSRGTGGKGIGLTIAKAVVEAHCGTIKIQSEPTEGTAVTVQLPLMTTEWIATK